MDGSDESDAGLASATVETSTEGARARSKRAGSGAQRSATPRLPGARTRSRDERRTRIIDAGMKLFARDGYEATTMTAIAEEAGVGRRTLFRYYATKKDVALAHWDGMIEEFLRLLEDRPEDETASDAMMQALLTWIGKLSVEQMIILSDLPIRLPDLRAHNLQKYEYMENAFAEIIHLRRGQDMFAARITAAAVISTWRLAYERWWQLGRRGHMMNVAIEAFDILKKTRF